MLVVLFVLLMATATGLYAVHSTVSEIRGAGFYRQASQTQHLAETGLTASLSWVDRNGPEVLLRSTGRSAASPLNLAPFESVNLAPGMNGLRLYGAASGTDGSIIPGELNANVTNAIDEADDVVGPLQSYQPYLAVDVYDTYQYVGVIAGYPAAAQGNLRFLGATYTARGRTRLPTETQEGDLRFANETASDARTRGVSGPF